MDCVSSLSEELLKGVDAVKDDEDKPRRLDFKGSVTNHQQEGEPVAAAAAEPAAK